MGKRYLSLFLVLAVLFALSGCGGKEEQEGWLVRLGRLATETAIERSEEHGDMVEEGMLELVIDKIHPGSFTREDANEIFLDCWFKGMPHMGGLDSRAGIILDADTLEVIAYKEFLGDRVTLAFPRTAKGLERVLFLDGTGSQGTWIRYVSLWSVQDGQWEALPTGIADCVRYVKGDREPFDITEHEKYENGTEIRNGFCYLDETMDEGYRLAVTCEYGFTGLFQPGSRPEAELTAILSWNPYTERFELEGDTVQPAAQQAQPEKQ